LLGLNERLKDLYLHGKSINVGIVGLGQMGLSLVSHLKDLKGFNVCAVADKNLKKINLLYEIFPLKEKEIYTFNDNDNNNDNVYDDISRNTNLNTIQFKSIDNLNLALLDDSSKDISYFLDFNEEKIKKINLAAENGKIIFTNNFYVFPFINKLDIVVDATGYPEVGAEIAFISLLGGKDLVTLNVETDVTIGPLLKKIALSRDLVYTLSAGDEPAVLKELYDFTDALGFKIVCAGKGKNNPLNFHANPDTILEYALSKGTSTKMMTSFVDGTKSMVEMACLSNATGLIPDCRGMHGPKVNIADLLSTFCLKANGGILDKEGVVDFVIGDLAPGVFLIYKSENKHVQDVIKYLNLGNGPNYLIYKPYHLTSIETPLSIALAYFERQPWIVPKDGGLVSEIITLAKKDLKAGDIIDGIGGYTVYGLIEVYKEAKNLGCLPIGLSSGCVLKKNKSRDSIILFDDVEFPNKEKSLILKLREIQDKEIQGLNK